MKSRDDNFFALGGDSVKALRFAEQAARTLGTDIPLSRFFAKPTIHGVAAYLREGGGGRTEHGRHGGGRDLRRAPGAGPVPAWTGPASLPWITRVNAPDSLRECSPK